MLLRADEGVSPDASPGIREFVQFLDRYAELARIVNTPIRGLMQSPFVFNPKFTHGDDIRRKAEEVRAHLGLGTGPVVDLDPVCELLGITLYRSPLGSDLRTAPSGAFLNHPDVGFSIVINLDMTPGRRRFTIAHELAHALFHSSERRCVLSRGQSPLESFADSFAGEFLMPSEGVRRFMEETRMGPRLVDAVDMIHIQRYFHVSWPTALVRLRQMNAITAESYRELKATVRPVSLARSLGYSIHSEEYTQDAERWRVHRFPRTFQRMLRRAVISEVMSPPSAASFAGLAIPDLVQILGQPSTDPDEEPPNLQNEFSEYEETGVI